MTARVPVGIDPGFQHNAGAVGRKAFATPPPVAAKIAEGAGKIAEGADPLAIPDFLRRAARPAPGGVRAGLVEDAVTAAEHRAHAPGYVAPEALPGRAADYFGEDYGEINDAMRAGLRPPTERLRAVADDMKSAMTPLAEDVTVWRGRQSVKTHNRGDILTDDAFASTSTSWRTAVAFADASGEGGGTLYRLHAPKGIRAVVENDMEQEITFAPNQKWRVIDVIDGARAGANARYAGPDRVYIVEAVND